MKHIFIPPLLILDTRRWDIPSQSATLNKMDIRIKNVSEDFAFTLIYDLKIVPIVIELKFKLIANPLRTGISGYR